MKDLEKRPALAHQLEVQEVYHGDEYESKKESRVISVFLDIKQLQEELTPLQLERLLFLVGPQRIQQKEKLIKITIKHYMEPYHNYLKALDILEELYLETLRAP